MDRFRALVIDKDAEGRQSVEARTVERAAMMPGDTLVRVTHSTVNYKDGLAITGRSPVVRRFPMVPGVDLAGTVVETTDARYRPGDAVVLNGWGLGESHWGAYAAYAQVSGEWLIPLPPSFTPAEAMAIGTAGYTAMLARRGWHVIASTGRSGEADYLKGLGAAEVIDRAALAAPGRPLGRERWAAGVDSVGSTTLANVLAATRPEGAIAACGLAGGMDLPATVAPFILRGVSLLGVNSVTVPRARRLAAWERLAADLDRTALAAMTEVIGFDAIVPTARRIVEGGVRGRVVVRVAEDG